MYLGSHINIAFFRFATLLHQCLNSFKKGSAKEMRLASHVIGLFCNPCFGLISKFCPIFCNESSDFCDSFL